MSIQIFALTNPQEKVVQLQTNRVRATVQYLDREETTRSRFFEHWPVARRHLKGYLQALSYIAVNRSIDQGYTASNRWECFHQAIHLIQMLIRQEQTPAGRIDHLHAHFAHDPALIAYLINRITGLPFSFTAHARDLYQVPVRPLTDRINAARAVVTCCRANLDYLMEIAPAQRSKFSLIYHGVNLEDFRMDSISQANVTPACPLILSVGRLVEKKGFHDLLQALLLVKKRGMGFRCEIYGDGPLKQALMEWIEGHGMTAEVVLMGDRTQQELIPVYQNASLFVLTPIQTEDGDRDGIPNVLVEAMAVGLPVITTAVSGIPELVDHNRNGLLYRSHDVEEISEGIIELLGNAEKRRQLGSAALKKVQEQFDISQAARQLKTLFYLSSSMLVTDE